MKGPSGNDKPDGHASCRKHQQRRPQDVGLQWLREQAEHQSQHKRAGGPDGALGVLEGRGEKAGEQLQRHRDDEQQDEAEGLNLAVRLRELRPGGEHRQSETHNDHQQEAGSESRQDGHRERDAHGDAVGVRDVEWAWQSFIREPQTHRLHRAPLYCRRGVPS